MNKIRSRGRNKGLKDGLSEQILAENHHALSPESAPSTLAPAVIPFHVRNQEPTLRESNIV